jgi:hypothetical protein
MSPTDEERLSQQVDQILKENRIEPMLECQVCGAELTLRMEVIPGDRPTLSRIAYNCEYCLAMNVVWASPDPTHH